VIIPSMMGNKKENIETLLADLCSNILSEFSTVVRADFRSLRLCPEEKACHRSTRSKVLSETSI
jgi:hypothetical protein